MAWAVVVFSAVQCAKTIIKKKIQTSRIGNLVLINLVAAVPHVNIIVNRQIQEEEEVVFRNINM